VAHGEVAEETQTSSPVAAVETTPENWRHNFLFNFLDITFFSLGLAFVSINTIIPLFIRELGGSTILVGLVPAIIQTGWLLPPLFIAPYIASKAYKLPIVLRITLGERLPWPILALATLFLADDYPRLMLGLTIALLAIFGLSGGLAMPAWLDFVAHVTPLRIRGKLFGWSSALGGALGVGGGLLAEYMLARYAFPTGFVFCFAGASVCMAISYVGLLLVHEGQREHPGVERASSVRQYLHRLPSLLRADHDFAAFLVARCLMALGSMALAFVAVYATEQQGLPTSLAGRFTAVMVGTQVITTPIWGTLGDRYGHKGALQFSLTCSTLAMALTRWATDPLGFYVIFALLGAGTGILFTSNMNMVVEFAKPTERIMYIGLHGTLVAPATLAAPLIGGWIAAALGFMPLFTAAAVCSLLGLIVMTLLVRDPRHRQVS
jgi:MFS family permease